MSQGFLLETKPRKQKSHPEINEIKPGDLLMGVSFESEDLNAELQKRIEELKNTEKKKEDDEDDDDDGAKVPALV